LKLTVGDKAQYQSDDAPGHQVYVQEYPRISLVKDENTSHLKRQLYHCNKTLNIRGNCKTSGNVASQRGSRWKMRVWRPRSWQIRGFCN